ncbi:hypothetical protein [Seohaeicola zhoushanensis]|uniref:Dihydroorotate dehydrogenase n=1 Tax=Seohaeicola zhoushanensis TaxID=1569283 RepID=A0A8J3GYA9_9RHOB|nr:hypothetical protein [Seohaeicola zhoushanensis]GHF50681.1 hypothetical protein GCM10017056_22980 [Seohaeicola zhoushanensis]
MTEREFDTGPLDDLFAAARAAPPALPPALAARMLADAGRVLDERQAPRPAMPGWRAQLAEAIGGWFGVGGLAAACAAGLWIGLAPPAGLPDPVGLFGQSQTSYDLFQGSDLALALSEDG